MNDGQINPLPLELTRAGSGPVTLAVVGTGSRGMTYGSLAIRGGRAAVVAVAEPREARRARAAERFAVLPDQVFADWRELAGRPRLADAVVITTQDRMHTEPAVAFAGLGYHILLEKPMAPTEPECLQIIEAAERAGILLAVCHVMRYTAYTRMLKGLVDGRAIGDIVSVEHLEPIGWWHYAHSFVRGNWRREDEATPMLLAKSCHDLDWLAYVVGRRVERVSSFGGLYHFRPEQRPDGAADRCLDCEVEATCPYSAPRLYRTTLARYADRNEIAGWPVDVITDDLTAEGVERALRDGPYGRCVYTGDNDVVDHQVVALQYEGGVTASFTMTAFAPAEPRKTRIFGTHGFIDGDGEQLRVVDFRTMADSVHSLRPDGDASAAGGHGGGDGALVDAFIHAVATGDPGTVLTGPRESLESHQIVWAAERARHTGTVVSL